jgi:hypothetical protein
MSRATTIDTKLLATWFAKSLTNFSRAALAAVIVKANVQLAATLSLASARRSRAYRARPADVNDEIRYLCDVLAESD